MVRLPRLSLSRVASMRGACHNTTDWFTFSVNKPFFRKNLASSLPLEKIRRISRTRRRVAGQSAAWLRRSRMFARSQSLHDLVQRFGRCNETEKEEQKSLVFRLCVCVIFIWWVFVPPQAVIFLAIWFFFLHFFPLKFVFQTFMLIISQETIQFFHRGTYIFQAPRPESAAHPRRLPYWQTRHSRTYCSISVAPWCKT